MSISGSVRGTTSPPGATLRLYVGINCGQQAWNCFANLGIQAPINDQTQADTSGAVVFSQQTVFDPETYQQIEQLLPLILQIAFTVGQLAPTGDQLSACTEGVEFQVVQ